MKVNNCIVITNIESVLEMKWNEDSEFCDNVVVDRGLFVKWLTDPKTRAWLGIPAAQEDAGNGR